MCEIRATPYAIQRSLRKGTRLILLCVYQTGGKARYLLPIWLHILTLTTKARTRLALTTPSRKLTVWVALTCEVWQWMKLSTVYEGKWKMTRTLFQRKLTANRLCRTGQPIDVNPLIVIVSISFNLIFMSFCYGFNLNSNGGRLWRFVCCCLATMIARLNAATATRGSWRVCIEASVERAVLSNPGV